MKKQFFLLLSLGVIAPQILADLSSWSVTYDDKGTVYIEMPSPTKSTEQKIVLNTSKISQASNILYGLTAIYQAQNLVKGTNTSDDKECCKPANNKLLYALTGVTTLAWGAAHGAQNIGQTDRSYPWQIYAALRTISGVVLPLAFASQFFFPQQ